MPRYGYGRRKKKRAPWLTLTVLVVGTMGLWWLMFGGNDPETVAIDDTEPLAPALTSHRPEVLPTRGPREDVAEKGDDGQIEKPGTESGPSPESIERRKQLIAAGKESLKREDLITARSHFSEAMQLKPSGVEAAFLRAELTRIGNESVFSHRVFERDPLVEVYTVKSGDTLGKIAKGYRISADLIANVNGIRNKNMIRVGQRVKVLKGPFRAVVNKRDYTLDVYLADTFVRSYKVGLGEEGSTPTGEWQVSTKLENPTYFPPRGGAIVAADDPENPLGEHWIGLVGIKGQALGAQRYGIHGTIEPESIGSNRSLGCIRMYNEDVAELYTFLVSKFSKVVVFRG